MVDTAPGSFVYNGQRIIVVMPAYNLARTMPQTTVHAHDTNRG